MTDIILEETKQIKDWLDEAKKNNKVLALLVVGDSCSGKTMRLGVLSKQLNLYKIITTTTRPIRPQEKPNVDYHFLTEEEFQTKKNNNEFLEVTNYGFNYYGTEKKEFMNCVNSNKNCYLILDINGIINVKNELELKYNKEFLIKTIYYKIDKNTFLSRIAKRDKNKNQDYINSRLHENELAALKIKNNPKLIDYTIDSSKQIDQFAEKDNSTNYEKQIL